MAGNGSNNSGGTNVGATDRFANWAAVLDDRLRSVMQPQSGVEGRSGGPFGAVAFPAAMLGGLFGATLVGALSYRRSAKALARQLPPAPKPPTGKAVHPPPDYGTPPKASEVLTKGELLYLFVVPGIFSAAIAVTVGGICRYALDVDSVDDAVRQIRWLLGNGARPARVASGTQLPNPRSESE
eukprot:TRINITY_DN39954_c0_g1_i1.p1 TRINITY_DN39954_c0_g1~~TRINITY_DN39954_c0_g1_i1.p1  ORF type:complete len:214 (+),score=29.73 TRINITY_DN39954_c0_g1_i1:96-644(+)